MNKSALALTPLALILNTTLYAQEYAIEDGLYEVTVTASRIEQTLMDVPMSVSVVDEQAIKNTPTASLAELLRDVPGVQIQDTQGAKRISIRGESAHRILVIVDGQKISEQKSMSGVPLLVDPSQIERIEVIKGPASVLYGSEAIGGVVNIVTKKGGDRPIQLDVNSRYSSAANEFYNSATIAGSSGGFEYRLSGALTNADDIRVGGGGRNENSDYKQNSFNLYTAFSGLNYKLGASYDKFEQDFGDLTPYYGSSYTMYQKLPQWSREKVALFTEYTPKQSVLKRLRFDAGYQTTLKDFQMKMLMGPMTMVDSRTENNLDDYNFGVQSDWMFGDTHNVVFGAEYLISKVDADATNYLTSTLTNEKAQQNTFALYLQDSITVNDDWALTLGGRYTYVDNGDYRSTDVSNGDKQDVSYNNTVGSLAAVYTGFDNLSLRANFSQGFRSASLMDIYLGSGSFIPNPDLKPEKSNNYEIGARYDKGGWMLDTSIYLNDASNYMETQEIGDSEVYQKVNRDKAKTIGWETALSYTMENGIEPYLNSTISQRETTDDGFTTNDVGLPWLQGNAGLRYENYLGNLTYQLSGYSRFAVRTKDESSDGSIEEHAGWATLNASAGINGEFMQRNTWGLNLVIENMLDKRYEPANENGMGYAAGINVSVIGSLSFK